MKQPHSHAIFAAVIAASLFAASAFAASPDVEVAARGGELVSPEIASAIEAFERRAADHVASRLAEYRERFKDEIPPELIHYELSELAVDRADERIVSMRAIFRLWGIGAVNEHDAFTATIDCATLEELTPDDMIADKSAFVEAAVRAIAEDAGVEPEVLQGRFDEDSLGTVMGDEPEQLAISMTENGARVTYSLIRGQIGAVDVPLDTPKK